MPSGGKRIGAGAKKGSHNKHSVKDGSLVVHAPRMIELAKKWLYGKDTKNQQWAFKELMPYVFRKQPQETQLTGNVSVTIAYEKT